jgi:hypothetical protein
LISPSWLIVWTTLIRGLEFVYDPSSGCQLIIPIQDEIVRKGPTLPFFIVELGDIFSCCLGRRLGKHDFSNHKLISPLARGMGTEQHPVDCVIRIFGSIVSAKPRCVCGETYEV